MTTEKLFIDIKLPTDVLYSLDVVGWIETGQYHTNTHWHYREIKAIDEAYRLPWEQFDSARYAKLLIHKGASKHVLGHLSMIFDAKWQNFCVRKIPMPMLV